MTKDNALVPAVPVPLGISKLEDLPINAQRRLNADDKKRLLEILNKKLRENKEALDCVSQEVRENILADAKAKAGLDKFIAQHEEIDTQISALKDKQEAITLRCENSTGFTMEGKLLPQAASLRAYTYGRTEDADEYDRLWKAKRDQGIKKANAVRDKMDSAIKQLERFATKFDKVQTRLLLADTYGEAMAIMDAVLGNGDEILSVDSKEGTDE